MTDARSLTEENLWELAERIDVPAALRMPDPPDRLRAEPGDGETLRFADLKTDETALLPAAAFRAMRRAAWAATVALDLLPPSVVTAGVVAGPRTAWWHAWMLSQALTGITHIAVTAPGPVPTRLTDRLELAGVCISVGCGARAAAFGATLVVTDERTALSPESVTGGAILIEAVRDCYPPALRTPPEDGRARPFQIIPPPDEHRAAAMDSVLATALLSANHNVVRR